MGENRTEVIRADPKQVKFMKDMQKKKMMKEGKITPIPRIGLAMLNQYLRYPDLIKELERTNLK